MFRCRKAAQNDQNRLCSHQAVTLARASEQTSNSASNHTSRFQSSRTPYMSSFMSFGHREASQNHQNHLYSIYVWFWAKQRNRYRTGNQAYNRVLKVLDNTQKKFQVIWMSRRHWKCPKWSVYIEMIFAIAGRFWVQIWHWTDKAIQQPYENNSGSLVQKKQVV